MAEPVAPVTEHELERLLYFADSGCGCRSLDCKTCSGTGVALEETCTRCFGSGKKVIPCAEHARHSKVHSLAGAHNNPKDRTTTMARHNPEEVQNKTADAGRTVLSVMAWGGYLPNHLMTSHRVVADIADNEFDENKCYSYILIKAGRHNDDPDISKEVKQFIAAWIVGGRKQPFRHVRMQEWDMYGDGSYRTLLFTHDPSHKDVPNYIFFKTHEEYFDALGVKPLRAIRENPRRSIARTIRIPAGQDCLCIGCGCELRAGQQAVGLGHGASVIAVCSTQCAAKVEEGGEAEPRENPRY